MRDSAWVVGGVIAGLLVALWFSTVVAAMGQPSGSIYPDQVHQERQAKDRETRQWMWAHKDYPPREAYEPSCKDDGKREECLMAWRSARAAESQARAAVDQVWWARAGTLLVLFTLIATICAAYFAYQAAHATHMGAIADQASAVAADKTLKEMQAAGRRELRAYVSGGGYFLRSGEGTTQTFTGTWVPMKTNIFEVKVNNYGATPADVIDVEIGFCDSGNIPPNPMFTITRLIGGTIPPGKEEHATEVTFKRDEIKGDVIFGRFRYTDIFKDRIRSSGFILKIEPDLIVSPIRAPAAYTDWD